MGSSVIITVVVVLAIIVAGGFLLYFMGDLFMSLAHKGKDDAAIREKQEKKTKELEDRVNALENSNEAKKDPQIATILYNGAVVENYNPEEEEKVEEEQVEQPAEESEVESEEAVEEPVEEEAAEEETAEESPAEEDDTSDYIKQRRAELMERLARMQQEEEEETEEEEEAVDLSEGEEQEEQAEEAVEEEPAEEEASEETTDVPASNISLEDLEKELAETQEKLKANEKELRQCKKEFIPLRRVKKTLESDEKKLRRKEALVAKQKVVLYGVNNYSDIDEEKAKKLAEDLDLLDGLKLSVQHCEEVMSKNAERYPLLEKIFNLLSAQNAELKENIKNLQEAIEELKNGTDTADAE